MPAVRWCQPWLWEDAVNPSATLSHRRTGVLVVACQNATRKPASRLLVLPRAGETFPSADGLRPSTEAMPAETKNCHLSAEDLSAARQQPQAQSARRPSSSR